MNLTPKRIFDIEVIISPVAMASIQTQFVVGNRQQFGFLYGEILISDNTYRCDDYIRPNTFYITSVMPVFDADTFLSEVLKSNNKTVADAFWKYAVKNKKREPILGWYFQGNPNELLKGKDYSLHVKLIRQTFLLNQILEGSYQNRVAYHAFLAAVISYNKSRFSRDFSVGFQGFDEKIQLRMYDVKVNVVDHYFRPRLETDTCLINHSKILEFIRAEIRSEELRNIFDDLQEGTFARPPPQCYQVHGQLIDRYFDLLMGALKYNCRRAAESRNIELESQLFDYKAYEVDSKGYQAAMTIIDKTKRTLNVYELTKFLNDLDFDQSRPAVSMERVDQSSLNLSKPRVIADALKRISLSPTEEETKDDVSSAEMRSPSTEKVNPHVLSSSLKSDRNLKDTVDVRQEDISITQNLKEPSTESTPRENLDIQVEIPTAESISRDVMKTASDDDSSSKTSNVQISKSKKKRKKRKKRGASSMSHQADVDKSSASIAEKSDVQTSPEEQHLEKKSSVEKASPFSNVPRNQLLIYSITSPKQSLSDSTLIPIHDDRVGQKQESTSTTEIQENDSSPSISSYTSEDDEGSADSKPREMQIRIIKRNPSARVNIPLASISEIKNPTELLETLSKKKDESPDTGCGLHESVDKNLLTADLENTSSSKPYQVDQNLNTIICQDPQQTNKKCKEELKYESSETGVVSGLADGAEKHKLVVSHEASSIKPKQPSNQMLEKDQSKSSEQTKASYEKSKTTSAVKTQLPSKEVIKTAYKMLGKIKPGSVMSSVPDRLKTPPDWLQEFTERTAQQIDKMLEDLALGKRTPGAVDLKKVHKKVTLYLNPAPNPTYTVTTSPSAQPKSQGSIETDVAEASATKASNSTFGTAASLNVNVTTSAVETKITASHLTTSVVSREKSSTRQEAPDLTESSPAVRKSKSRKSTTPPEVSTDESSNLPWPRSKNACIIIPKIKSESRVDDLWKYALHSVPDSLLTALKSLQSWRNKTNVEVQTYSCSGHQTSPDPPLPDFQDAFESVLNRESWNSLPSRRESLPPIILPQRPDSVLFQHQLREQNRLRRLNLSSYRRSLRIKPFFLSTVSASPLETVYEERRSTSVEYENASCDACGEIIPLCLLGDESTLTAVSTEEKYADLSTISSSDSDTETNSSISD